jgi:parvulin-like peptidyl-prolyl isomerase
MQHLSIYKKLIPSLLLVVMLSLSGCSNDEEPASTGQTAAADDPAEPAAGKMSAEEEEALGDVIARVGDQEITFNQINTMLNSSAVVGVSVPALGTPERDTARIVVLDKVISANLLYLDALRQGVDKDPAYQRAMQSFTAGQLGSQYQQKIVAGEITVSDEEIQAFFDEVMKPGSEMTDDLRIQIEATLRKRKLHQRMQAEREAMRKEHQVLVYPDRLPGADETAPADSTVIASIDDAAITWGEVKSLLIAAGKGATAVDPLAMPSDAQLEALQNEIDKRIIADKAREQGLDKDPVYQARLQEYQKTRLVNLHRASLARQMEPSDEQLKAYYEANRMRIMQVEMRKLQEALLESKEQAEMLKQKVEAGELTMFQVAAEYSKAPGAKQNLGEVGWIAKGRAQPALDKVIFELAPGEIGGPVESTEGWHLFKVLDVAEAKFANLDEVETRQLTRRRYIHDKLNDYVANLRKNDFDVEVYEPNLVRLAQKEADMVARLSEEASKPGSKTEHRLEELNKLIGE